VIIKHLHYFTLEFIPERPYCPVRHRHMTPGVNRAVDPQVGSHVRGRLTTGPLASHTGRNAADTETKPRREPGRTGTIMKKHAHNDSEVQYG